MTEAGETSMQHRREYDERDFETLSWHDDSVYGLRLRVGDPEAGDWTSDLVLDLDHIVEWVRAPDGDDGHGIRFRVAPAELVFHGVTDLSVDLPSRTEGMQVALSALMVDGVERAPVEDQRVYLDRTYYAWRIALNDPSGGLIRFGAVGFTMRLLREPLLLDRQHLTRAERESRPE
ncbi:MAG: hypothetical protein GEU80_00380 [Dehalococcoidia bacterium]|nr:hypothetical protein [Dehalococcoidia bacterium]